MNSIKYLCNVKKWKRKPKTSKTNSKIFTNKWNLDSTNLTLINVLNIKDLSLKILS